MTFFPRGGGCYPAVARSKLITHPHLFHDLRMNEAISPFRYVAVPVQFQYKTSQKTRPSKNNNLVLVNTSSHVKKYAFVPYNKTN